MTDWRARAACRDEDPELFFPVGMGPAVTAQINEAKGVCFRCPVRSTCLAWALESGEDAGVWGGMTDAERRRFKRTNPVAARKAECRRAADEDRVVALMRGEQVAGSKADKQEAAHRLLARGMTKNAIAQRMGLSWRTVSRLLGSADADVRRAG